MLSSESALCDPICLSIQSLESQGTALLMVVVAVAEDALMLTLRPEVSSGDSCFMCEEAQRRSDKILF